MSSDLISRQAAIDALRTHERKASKKWFDNQLDIEWNNAIDICCYDIEDLPSAQPEIVMCEDCKKYIDYRCRDEHANLSDWRHEDDYCSYAERREVSE